MTKPATELFVSSCEVPEQEVRPARRLRRFDPVTFSWEGIPVQVYKPAVESALAWEGVARHTLVGASGDPTAFHLRYFEIQPGGFSSLERHRHAHAVIVLRGHGSVRVGAETFDVRPFDLIYVPPEEPHQFQNADSDEPFGFLCPVDAQRDPPRPVEQLRRP
jgi:quercetin dioxygenase-like cupin family protein